MVPPLERLERREGAERQGGEFVEAYVAKRTKQISPTRALALDASATSAGSEFKLKSVYIGWLVPPLERLENLLDFCVEGRSLDLPNSERCDAASIAYPLHRPRF